MNEKEKGWSSGALTALIAMPILYVLSIGPVDYWLVRSHSTDLRLVGAVIIFYKPLAVLYHHTPLRTPLDVYIGWWTELGGGTP